MKAPEPILIYRVYVLGMTAVYLYRCCAVSVERFNRDLTIAEQVKRGDKLVIDENVVVELAGIDVIHGYSLLYSVRIGARRATLEASRSWCPLPWNNYMIPQEGQKVNPFFQIWGRQIVQ